MKWTTKSLEENCFLDTYSKFLWFFGQTYLAHLTVAESGKQLQLYSFDYLQNTCHLKHSKWLNVSSTSDKTIEFNLLHHVQGQ